jgi:RNA polymerase sigma factor (sigma-70 family)
MWIEKRENSMATAGLSRVLQHLRQALPDGAETDAQLLARFTREGEEAAFAALVRRHGPMVLAVCRRVLGHLHDAEDAFQATFLVLARKAGSVIKAESLGCFLYRVAWRVALEARTIAARRRAREVVVSEVPHPLVDPVEPDDWRPVLNEELTRLPEKYRTALVLCALEGKTYREAAGQLGLPEGTLCSRLSAARQILARRLARRGVTLPAAALTVALSEQVAGAAVPAALMDSAVRGAVLVSAGLEAAAATPAAVLMKGVLKAMFLTKLKLVVTVAAVAGTLGVGGFAYRVGTPPTAQAQTPAVKPMTDLEALRKENELLKLNLQVVLEKVRAQEAELKSLKEKSVADKKALSDAKLKEQRRFYAENVAGYERNVLYPSEYVVKPTDPVAAVEAALKALKEARDEKGKRQAAEALEKATQKLKQQLKGPANPSPGR